MRWSSKDNGKGKGKVIPLQARCGTEGVYNSSTLPWPRHKKGVNGQQHASGALYPRESNGTHFTGGWVGPSVGLDGRKISSQPGFDPGPSSPLSVGSSNLISRLVVYSPTNKRYKWLFSLIHYLFRPVILAAIRRCYKGKPVPQFLHFTQNVAVNMTNKRRYNSL